MVTSQSDSNLMLVLCNMYSRLGNTHALCVGGEGAGGKGRSKKWQEYLELPTPHEALPLKRETGECVCVRERGRMCVCVCDGCWYTTLRVVCCRFM